jgi:hypothetical protein
VRASILPDDWERYRVLGETTLNIVGAGGRRMRQKGTITMIVEIGRLQIKSRFLIFEGLAAAKMTGLPYTFVSMTQHHNELQG